MNKTNFLKPSSGHAIIACIALSVLTLSVNAQTLYSNDFQSTNAISRLSLDKGASQAERRTYNFDGRSGTGVKLKQLKSNDWTSILGNPDFSNKRDVTLKYSFYAPSSRWEYRLQGKLPGLQPDRPHFGGNKNDAPVWDKWSVRLMWISTSGNINVGNDGRARPSVYIYDQDRQVGSFGKHHIVDGLYLPKSDWVDVEMYVKVNSHQAGTGKAWRNGEVQLYINGNLEKTVSGLKLIGDLPSQYGNQAPSQAKISKIAFHNYYGGSKSDSKNVPLADDTFIYMDNLEVINGLSISN
ncbi:hypothetical protein L0668_12255 [Paraglaciecola aquimarina]|uniref:Polysaccharide lyase 14 domain-containing protein n=1 Tax=Paraglaciecola algarum TaxID=3050085 RepID=A0ABS9D7J1_9ALTE|nr:hypothetical protein [Paraglaciecola sp. G1-23]MCF2948884.1 hypothetical protein [Paraglaciecola sp. G1-23]